MSSEHSHTHLTRRQLREGLRAAGEPVAADQPWSPEPEMSGPEELGPGPARRAGQGESRPDPFEDPEHDRTPDQRVRVVLGVLVGLLIIGVCLGMFMLWPSWKLKWPLRSV